MRMIMSLYQNVGQNHTMVIANESFENVAKYKISRCMKRLNNDSRSSSHDLKWSSPKYKPTVLWLESLKTYYHNEANVSVKYLALPDIHKYTYQIIQKKNYIYEKHLHTTCCGRHGPSSGRTQYRNVLKRITSLEIVCI